MQQSWQNRNHGVHGLGHALSSHTAQATADVTAGQAPETSHRAKQEAVLVDIAVQTDLTSFIEAGLTDKGCLLLHCLRSRHEEAKPALCPERACDTTQKPLMCCWLEFIVVLGFPCWVRRLSQHLHLAEESSRSGQHPSWPQCRGRGGMPEKDDLPVVFVATRWLAAQPHRNDSVKISARCFGGHEASAP